MSETLYVKVYLNKPIPEQANKFEAKQRRVAVEVANFRIMMARFRDPETCLERRIGSNGTFDTTTKTFTPGE